MSQGIPAQFIGTFKKIFHGVGYQEGDLQKILKFLWNKTNIPNIGRGIIGKLGCPVLVARNVKVMIGTRSSFDLKRRG